MAFDYDLLVIGAGSGGLAAAERAAAYGAKVAIAERAAAGGACVNYGCIPEKLLDYAANFKLLDQVAADYGWGECDRQFDWSHFVDAKNKYIQHLNELHFNNLRNAGVQFIKGQAAFVDAHTLIVADQPINADKILIAVGARPVKPDIPGIEHTITWHELYRLPTQPKHLAIYGGDPIGVKVAGSMNALGSQVTQIITEDYILSGLDAEMSKTIQNRMIERGITFFTQTHIKEIKLVDVSETSQGDRYQLTLSDPSIDTIAVDAVLMDAPRKPNLANLNLGKVGIQLTASGAIRVDEFSRTTHANVFAVGDCTDRIPLTPSAIAQGRTFADAEFGGVPHAVRLDLVPFSIASRPEAATVGLSEEQARQKWGDAVHCYRTQFRPLLYSLSEADEKFVIKVVVNRQDSERVLGIHIIGDGAVEIVQSLAVALRLGVTKQDLDRAIGIHPSSAEEVFAL